MWILFGSVAIITAILNVIWRVRGKESIVFAFISLSFTALTLCAFYYQAAQWVKIEYWAALMDVMPSMSKLLWMLTIVSIAVNSISLLKKGKRKI